VLTLGFIYGAYMTETFRGAILSIPAASSRPPQRSAWARCRPSCASPLPQMVRYALPGFTNNWLVLIKATALVSLIGLQEMTYLAKQASAATRSPFAFFLFTGALFLLYTWASLSGAAQTATRATAWAPSGGNCRWTGKSSFRPKAWPCMAKGIVTTLWLLSSSLAGRRRAGAAVRAGC
jgi:ABC-type arginine transport system permease subunit